MAAKRRLTRRASRALTCTLSGRSRFLEVRPQLAPEVFLPEFGKPNVAAVVGQRATLEVAIER